MKEELKNIRITERTYNKIKKLAAEKNKKQITILEYLLNGKIKLKELN